MKIHYAVTDGFWRLRLLPSIEFSRYERAGIDRLSGYKYELVFWFWCYCISIEFCKVGEE